jgi:acid phosphatase
MRTLRRSWRGWIGAATGLLTVAAFGTTQIGARVAAAAGPPQLDHVFTIVMENHNYGTILANTTEAPYTNSLINRYSLAANYTAVAHPSLPNYLALTGGTTYGITTDCTDCFVTATSIADRITASGRTWKSYQESMPAPCFVGDAYPYAQKHNPFVYFNGIRTTSECNKDVPSTSLATDLASASTTPSYAFITPNLCNDTHDCPIATGDQWLSQNVPLILQSPAFTQQNSALFITYDEDDNGTNQVATIVITNSTNNVPAGYRSGVAYTHYSLLKTVEWAWGLAPLTANDTAAQPMADFFGAAPLTPAPTPAPVPAPTPTPVPSTGYAISLSASSTTAATGQPVSLTGTANRDIAPTPYGLSIIDTTTGQEVAHVGSGSVIVATVSQPTAGTHSYVAMVSNPGGANPQAVSAPVVVTWADPAGPPAPAPSPMPTPAPVPSTGYAAGLSASSTTAAMGQPVSLTGTANRDIGPTPYGLSIIDTTTGQEVAHIGSGSTIAAAVSQSAATTHSYVAMVCNRGGANAQASSTPVTITWS